MLTKLPKCGEKARVTPLCLARALHLTRLAVDVLNEATPDADPSDKLALIVAAKHLAWIGYKAIAIAEVEAMNDA